MKDIIYILQRLFQMKILFLLVQDYGYGLGNSETLMEWMVLDGSLLIALMPIAVALLFEQSSTASKQ